MSSKPVAGLAAGRVAAAGAPAAACGGALRRGAGDSPLSLPGWSQKRHVAFTITLRDNSDCWVGR